MKQYAVVETVADSADDVVVTVVYVCKNIQSARKLASQMYAENAANISELDYVMDAKVIERLLKQSRDEATKLLKKYNVLCISNGWAVHINPIHKGE